MTTSLPALFISIPEGIIDLGWGHPSMRLHPLDAIQQAATHAFAHTQTAMLRYEVLVQAAECLARSLTLYRTSSASPAGRGLHRG